MQAVYLAMSQRCLTIAGADIQLLMLQCAARLYASRCAAQVVERS
jgi:hypothetical protein